MSAWPLIGLHCFLLILALAMPLIMICVRIPHSRPSVHDVLWSVAPFLSLGVLSMLLLNIRGPQTVEWLIPGLAALIITLCARKASAYRFAYGSMVTVAIILWINFLLLINVFDYTASQIRLKKMLDAITRAEVAASQKLVKQHFDDTHEIPRGFVYEIGGKERPVDAECYVWSFEPEWHTGLTQLTYVRRQRALPYHLGDGKVELRIIEEKNSE